MRKKKLIWLSILVVVCFFCMGTDGCDSDRLQKSKSGAKQVTTFFGIPKNSKGNTTEQQNILDRLKITTDTTKVLWIHLITFDGKIIRRMPVRCKTTSSGKRLQPTHVADASGYYPDIDETSTYETDELIQPDGTYGESDQYQFWFDPMGRYHQWGTAGGLGYLLTDYPINLSDPVDEITGMYKVHQTALEWQKEQEEQLRKKEGKD